MKTMKRASGSGKSRTPKRPLLINRKTRVLKSRKKHAQHSRRYVLVDRKRRHRLKGIRRRRKHRPFKPELPVPEAQKVEPHTSPDTAYSQGFDEAYNEGFNAGFAKGYEDGHQLAYQSK